jgi:hypothetical protein
MGRKTHRVSLRQPGRRNALKWFFGDPAFFIGPEEGTGEFRHGREERSMIRQQQEKERHNDP